MKCSQKYTYVTKKSLNFKPYATIMTEFYLLIIVSYWKTEMETLTSILLY